MFDRIFVTAVRHCSGMKDCATVRCIKHREEAVKAFAPEKNQGKDRYAFLRGIYDYNGKIFRIEQAGSEKAYSFCVPPSQPTVRAAFYEASVDALAHMTLEQGRADKYRLVLGGISAPK